MPPRKTFTKTVGIRVTEEMYDKIYDTARRHGIPSIILREVIEAFADNRLKIKQTHIQGELYVN